MNLQLLNAFLQSLPPGVRMSVGEIAEPAPDEAEVPAPMAGIGCTNIFCKKPQY